MIFENVGLPGSIVTFNKKESKKRMIAGIKGGAGCKYWEEVFIQFRAWFEKQCCSFMTQIYQDS